MMQLSHEALNTEFTRQAETLLQMGYPELAGMDAQAFWRHLEPLKERLAELGGVDNGRIPFVIVIKSEMVAAEAAMEKVSVKGAAGAANMYPLEPKRFTAIEGLHIPDGMAYLLADIDTGRETLNVTPVDALSSIVKAERWPLTIDEGVALVTHFPEILQDKKHYNCFSMLGSRCGDKRVPALWISYGKPRLGWCWDGNPHTWLGSASCGMRVGVEHQGVRA